MIYRTLSVLLPASATAAKTGCVGGKLLGNDWPLELQAAEHGTVFTDSKWAREYLIGNGTPELSIHGLEKGVKCEGCGLFKDHIIFQCYEHAGWMVNFCRSNTKQVIGCHDRKAIPYGRPKELYLRMFKTCERQETAQGVIKSFSYLEDSSTVPTANQPAQMKIRCFDDNFPVAGAKAFCNLSGTTFSVQIEGGASVDDLCIKPLETVDRLITEVETWAQSQKHTDQGKENQMLKAKETLFSLAEKWIPGSMNLRLHFATKGHGTGLDCLPNDEKKYVRCWDQITANLGAVLKDKMTWNEAKKHCAELDAKLPWIAQAFKADVKEDIWTLKRCNGRHTGLLNNTENPLDQLITEVATWAQNKKDEVETWAQNQNNEVDTRDQNQKINLVRKKAKETLLMLVDKWIPGPVNLRLHFATNWDMNGLECIPNDAKRYVRCWDDTTSNLGAVSEDRMTWNEAKKHCDNQLPSTAQALKGGDAIVDKEEIWTDRKSVV